MTTNTDTNSTDTPWHRVSGPDENLAGWVNPDDSLYDASSLYARGRERLEVVYYVRAVTDLDGEPTGEYGVDEASHLYLVDDDDEPVDDPRETYTYDEGGWPYTIDDENEARAIAMRLAREDESWKLNGPSYQPAIDTRQHWAPQHCTTCWPLPRDGGTGCVAPDCPCHDDPRDQCCTGPDVATCPNRRNYRPATDAETADYLAGRITLPGAVETDHGLLVPTEPGDVRAVVILARAAGLRARSYGAGLAAVALYRGDDDVEPGALVYWVDDTNGWNVDAYDVDGDDVFDTLPVDPAAGPETVLDAIRARFPWAVAQ